MSDMIEELVRVIVMHGIDGLEISGKILSIDVVDATRSQPMKARFAIRHENEDGSSTDASMEININEFVDAVINMNIKVNNMIMDELKLF